MNNRKDIKLGFTLAEVLITLVIIGVIAALTVPTLMKNTQKQEFVTGLKKANSTLQQVMTTIARNNDAAVGDYSFLDDVDFIDEFAKAANVVKKCNTADECFGSSFTNSSGIYKALNGTNVSGLYADKAVITSDGIMYAVAQRRNTTAYGLSSEDSTNTLGRIFVDVNGHNGPNTFGRDTFIFYIVDGKGIIPAGADNHSTCVKTNTGFPCAAKVLKENVMNY